MQFTLMPKSRLANSVACIRDSKMVAALRNQRHVLLHETSTHFEAL